jgi:hypothetical protein
VRNLRILFIAGPTRSGSTLLARMLNEVPGLAAVGEVVSADLALQSSRAQGLPAHAAGQQYAPNAAGDTAADRFSGLCGCERALPDCPVWGPVEAAAFGDPPDYTRWDWEATRPTVGGLVARGPRRWRADSTRILGEVAGRLYAELARRTGAAVLVDESKAPLYGWFLDAQPWAEVVPVLLVRDPRATAASWSRPKRYAGLGSGAFPVHRAAPSATAWVKRVALADRLFGPRNLVVRYEDLVRSPGPQLQRILERLGCDPGALPEADTRVHRFGTNHILAANPDKFERGRVELRPPDGGHGLGRRDRAVVTALTLPLLRRHGYPVRPTAA